MLTLTKLRCEAAPLLLKYRREYQNDRQHLSGGFLVYLVTKEMSGIRLCLEDYWTLSKEERAEIRQAFKTA